MSYFLRLIIKGNSTVSISSTINIHHIYWIFSRYYEKNDSRYQLLKTISKKISIVSKNEWENYYRCNYHQYGNKYIILILILIILILQCLIRDHKLIFRRAIL